MVSYVTRRTLQAIANIIFVATLIFVLARATGDPVSLLLPQSASPAVVDQLRTELGLDKPLWAQFLGFLGQICTFDLGHSFVTGEPVSDVLLTHIGPTLELSLVALLLAVVVGVPLGVVSAVRRGSVIDTVAKGIALLGQAVPAFYLSILLILLFAVQLPWFPVAGRDGAASYVLPALALGWPALAGVLRLTRSSMLDALDADYVRMARAKGMHPSITVGKHALRNALIPVVTFSGLMLAGFLGGAVVIESIFNWQGIGQLTLDAIRVRDFPVVQGAVITVAIGFIVVNLFVDILYLVIDPRIRYE